MTIEVGDIHVMYDAYVAGWFGEAVGGFNMKNVCWRLEKRR